MVNRSMLERVQGSLMGAAIGDAMGMPWETLSAKQIFNLTQGLGVAGFSDPQQTRVSDTSNLKAGATTDDWQLTKVVARSLIRCRAWDKVDCAQEHVREYNCSLFGWGGTTTDAVREIKDGQRDVVSQMWRPEAPKGAGCGNGVAMKISPLAIFAALQNGSLPQNYLANVCMDLGALTHPDPRASFAAFAAALVIAPDLQTCVVDYEHDGKRLLEYVLGQVQRLEQRFADFRFDADTLSARLGRIPNSLASAETVRQVVGSGFSALETVPFAIATFLRHPTNFRAGVLEAVNAGGDTDTNASIVGAMIGANVGLSGIPEEWRKFRHEFGEAIDLGTQLYTSARCK